VLPILARLETVVVVDKPAGLLVHNSKFAGPPERTLVDVVREELGDGWSPVHRLDRQTSGCLLLAREDVAGWQRALAAGRKRYLALVRGHLREATTVDHAFKDPEGARREAITDVAPVARSTVERCSLIEARPRTGRTHQVRRHLKHLSHPVLGDANYGKGKLNRDYRARFGLARLALHCASLEVENEDGVRLVARAPLPADLREPLALLFPDLDLDGLTAETP
jgi:tRNA pseudouridine65 synthase